MATSLLLASLSLLVGAVLLRLLPPSRNDLPARLGDGDGARLADHHRVGGATVHLLPVGPSITASDRRTVEEWLAEGTSVERNQRRVLREPYRSGT
jgi:hypothetical protein